MTDLEKITIGLEWFLNPDHIPFVVADERGYYEDEELDVEIWEPEQHYDTLEMVATADLDYAITEPIHLVPERAAGTPVQGIAKFLHTRGGIMYPTERGWESPGDFEPGVRLNYPGAPGEGGRKMVAHMAQHAGGDLMANDIEPVEQGFYHTDALIEDVADLAFLAFYNFEIIEAQQQGFDAALFELSDYGVPDFNQLILATADSTIEENPGQIERFLRAVQRGVQDTVEDGEACAELFFERHPGVREEDPALMDAITDATLECFTASFDQDVRMYDELAEFCDELGLSDKRITADEVAAERLVERI